MHDKEVIRSLFANGMDVSAVAPLGLIYSMFGSISRGCIPFGDSTAGLSSTAPLGLMCFGTVTDFSGQCFCSCEFG